MNVSKQILILLILALLMPAVNGYGREEQEIKKVFTGKTAVQLNTIGGDCIVKAYEGDEIKVRFVHNYSNTKFEAVFLEEGKTLVLKEKFHISQSGNSTWYLTVPEKTVIRFASISGDFSIIGVQADIKGTTVSGDVKAKKCAGILELKSQSGDLEGEELSGNIHIRGVSSDLKVKALSGSIDVKTANGDLEASGLKGDVEIMSPSGDIRIKDSSGSFQVKTASGEIHVTNVEITKESTFKTASGDIYISLSKTLQHNLNLDTASGDALLNYNGHPIEGYFKFRIRAKSGEIISPFPFEKEEVVQKWGRNYEVKSFKQVFDKPTISIFTSSGTAVLKKD